MYNSRKIIIGLVIFVLVAAFPFFINVGKTAQPLQLSLNTPTINQLEKKECIESADYMRANHMRMLNEWRDQVVREGNTVYTSSSGQKYEMSLENNCFQCHSNKSNFCDSCHTYSQVDPYCWDCHNGTKGAGLKQ
ncbi:Multihaem cytochrome [Syntrophomonas zehnderi OL-4]|uniref:Multihaem cytochrome n=1 Tax=Syntrophomonas zehnderi OL-4 TaxID=690567 RepID=A0A0E4GAW6_9FIRM|nr:sulfate reduction electron transfer complex DsrMKJOP subunit DsrJ [Syntrophomonas zehnderi]CFX70946.1 Multihaem cytochrome [Syntrophomonas zehnderi OL-4]